MIEKKFQEFYSKYVVYIEFIASTQLRGRQIEKKTNTNKI